jgi:thiol-disulfide isomerase/thioredoxin
MKFVATILLFLFCISGIAEEQNEKIGTQAPEWKVRDWINSQPLVLEQLKGKVVLVRWWTAPHCPYCRATAPALNEFHEKYQSKGLVVVGFYHHKSDEALSVEKVKLAAGEFGFTFPVAIDHDWQTLKSWWLNGNDQRWTSVSFLLDRNGIIRHVHPGGEYAKGSKDDAILKLKIEELLQQK